MQVNVDKMLQAATDSGNFSDGLIDDKIFDENEKYPAFIVGRRKAPKLDPEDSESLIYNGDWQYEVFILLEKDLGFAELERITNQWINKLPAGEIKIESLQQYESLVSRFDGLVSALVVKVVDVVNVFNYQEV